MPSGRISVGKPGPVMASRLTTWVMPSSSPMSSHRALTLEAGRSSWTRMK